MHRTRFTAHARHRAAARMALACGLAPFLAPFLALALCAVPLDALAQTPAKPEALTLSQVFEAAWARQPEQAALAARREETRARQQAAQAWTSEPVALEGATKTDRFSRTRGTREYELGVVIPLWLPGERGRSQALAEAEGRAVESRTAAARLRLAASVREAWWQWQRAQAEAAGAQDQLAQTERLAADVRQRVQAGDLARADQHQADGVVAAAQAAKAHADGARGRAEQALHALVAEPGQDAPWIPAAATAEPEPGPTPAEVESHAEWLALQDRLRVADQQQALSATQSRANPELTISTTRDRGSAGEAWQQTVTVGLRVPFGAGPRHDARRAAARADTLELQAQLNLERARLAAERGAAQARSEAAALQLAAAERRAQLARESRGFFEKSFRLGQTDLPTRLRVEAEAADAERQAALARIDVATARSAWRQALGLLP